jgi:TPR repeat protein
MMEIDGVPIPVLRSVGEMLITGGRRDEGFAVLLDEVETLDVAAFSYAKYSYHPGITGGIARHDPRLLSFFKRSADDGVFRSLAFLGEIHAYGWGVERDVERGLSLLRAAARRTGSPMPHKKMGDLLFGVGREREAIAAWREAGERGDADAWYELGVSLSRSERFDEAVEAYRNVLAIEPRMHEALINLGLLIQAGAGTPRDDEAAFALFEQALEEDRTMAAYIVATCLIYSRGAEEDLERGVELMIESAKAGYKPAEVYLQELKRRRSRPPPYWARSTPGN